MHHHEVNKPKRTLRRVEWTDNSSDSDVTMEDVSTDDEEEEDFSDGSDDEYTGGSVPLKRSKKQKPARKVLKEIPIQ